jgi:hypothetical protein
MRIRVTTTYDFADDAVALEYLNSLVQGGIPFPVERFLKCGGLAFTSESEQGDKATTRFEIVRK